MTTDDRLKWLSGSEYAHSEPGQIAAELLTARVRIATLEAALLGITKLGGLTLLLGGRGLESHSAYEAGANAAFGQAADMARSALENASKDDHG